ncbi:MAG: 6,7-dimethyl-8-ribityllumazine synthase [Candidatus Nanopelagicales bacterium]
MSGSGAPEQLPDGRGRRLAIIAASWHDEVMSGLLAGARRAAQSAGAEVAEFRVPGSFELPVAAQAAARAGFDGVVALGVIIRGGTPHFEYVSAGVTQGLTEVAVGTGVPVGFGVLTCDTEAQALDRAGLADSSEDKGGETVAAVLATLDTVQAIGGRARPYAGFTPA